MALYLSKLFFYYLCPSAVLLMFLFRRVSTATPKAIMLHLDSLFGVFKCFAYLLSAKNISIKMLAEYLSSLVLYFILGINHYDVFNSNTKKHLPYMLRIARIDKNNLWKSI